MMSFIDFLHSRIGDNWVLARRTARIVQRYGESVVCLTLKKYRALETEWEFDNAFGLLEKEEK